MTVQRLVSQEATAGEMVARVLAEAGIDMVFGISGGHTGPHLRRPREAAERGPHRAGARRVARRRHGRGLRPAAPAAGRADRPGPVGARQRPARHAGGASVVVADAAADRLLRPAAISRCTRPINPAPAITAAGTRAALSAGVTKQVFQALEPAQAVQATQLAIKHAMSGQMGPVAVLFSFAALNGTVGPDTVPPLYPTQLYMPPPAAGADGERVAARRARRCCDAKRPVIIAGNGVRIAQAYEELQRAGRGARHPGRHQRRPARARSPRRTISRSASTARSARRPPTPSSAQPTSCWWSARSSAPPTRRARIRSCSIRRGRPSSRSTSSRRMPRGRSRPSMC